MARDGRIWFPLDVNFWRDPKILAAGEPAGVLFQAILGQIKLSGTEGVITRAEISSLGFRNPAPILAPLVREGLLIEATEGRFYVPAWEEWQQNKSRAAYMRAWRERKNDRVADPNHLQLVDGDD